jgi:Domain of unknown function (DUF4034)
MLRPTSSVLIMSLLLVSQLSVGCSFSIAPSRAMTRSAKKPEVNELVTFKPNLTANVDAATRTDNNAYLEYWAQIRDTLNREDFNRLDLIADDNRTNKRRFSGGAWKLYNFYLALNQPTEDQATDEVWRAHIDKLKKWAAQKPQSITAKVALGDTYLEYAWLVRGHGYANTVSDAAWQLFNERVALAKSILRDAKTLKQKCPYWYSAMQAVAINEGWDQDRYNELFEEAVAFEPSFEYFYSAKAVYLLPRWYGKDGDWERFADEASQRVGGKQGSMIYYVVSTEIWRHYRNRNFFQENDPSWLRIKRGFADMVQEYGTSMRELNRLAEMAVSTKDWQFTNQLFLEIGNNWDPKIWKGQQMFEVYRTFAKAASAASENQPAVGNKGAVEPKH